MELILLPNIATLDDSGISVTQSSETKIPCVTNALQFASFPSSCACRRITRLRPNLDLLHYIQSYATVYGRTDSIQHNEHCLSNHVLKPRSVGCHAGRQSCLWTAPTARASCLENSWFHLLQLSSMPWAPGWWLPSGLCRPSTPAHSTRRSPEAWGPDSLVTRPPAWRSPGRPVPETIRCRMTWFHWFC